MTVTIRVLSASEHCLKREDVDPDALKIIARLNRMGFLAYLCGGAVRDLLLGRKPKDFDIVTDARPGQIKKRFANVFIIGRRFRLAHVHFPGNKIIEVATFRRDLTGEEAPAPGERVPPELLYGTPREDSFRRDVTINALYYDAQTGEVIDYAGGVEDLAARRVRIIGDPAVRYTEDPVRIWRVVRYAARLGFTLEEETARAIPAFSPLLGKCAAARLYEELNKEFVEKTRPVVDALRAHGLLRHILGGFGEDFENDDVLYNRLRGLLDVKDRVQKDGAALIREEMYALFFWPWAESFFNGKEGDMSPILDRAFESAGTQAVFPKKMRADVVHLLTLIARIGKAFRLNRPSLSLGRQALFSSAFRVYWLIERGVLPGPDDVPRELFGHPQPGGETAQPEKTKRRRPRRRRRTPRPPQN
ncbi:MAG: hypothetical protein JW843_10690 [Candidatus Aminicenantes bacterium]|nr:hypothetical protein [Candidatus Aminicenantes bacterium]